MKYFIIQAICAIFIFVPIVSFTLDVSLFEALKLEIILVFVGSAYSTLFRKAYTYFSER